MYSFSKPTQAIAVIAGIALMSATPVAAGKNSVVGTSTATTALGAVATVPKSGGGSSINTGGGSIQTGFSGPALYAAPPGTVPRGNYGGTPTTLNGAPATAVRQISVYGPIFLVIAADGSVAVYPDE